MGYSYPEKIKLWEKELACSPPRKVRLKPSAIVVLLLYFLSISLVLLVASYLVITVALRKTFPAMEITMASSLLSLLVVGFLNLSERKKVMTWERAMGKIDFVLLVGADPVVPQYASFNVHYSHHGKTWSTRTSFGADIRDAKNGDPIILLVDPKNPKSCISYSGLSWEAVAENKH